MESQYVYSTISSKDLGHALRWFMPVHFHVNLSWCIFYELGSTHGCNCERTIRGYSQSEGNIYLYIFLLINLVCKHVYLLICYICYDILFEHWRGLLYVLYFLKYLYIGSLLISLFWLSELSLHVPIWGGYITCGLNMCHSVKCTSYLEWVWIENRNYVVAML